MVIATTISNARIRKAFVTSFKFLGLLFVSGGALSFLESTREEVFFIFLCALFVSAWLFAFFDGDTVDLYSGGIDIAWITRRNRHEYIQPLDHLAKDAVPLIQMRSGGVCDKEL